MVFEPVKGEIFERTLRSLNSAFCGYQLNFSDANGEQKYQPSMQIIEPAILCNAAFGNPNQITPEMAGRIIKVANEFLTRECD